MKAFFVTLAGALIAALSVQAQVGRRFPPEKTVYTDTVTHRTVTAICSPRYNSEKIYQSHPSWTRDGKYIIFYSDRGSGRQAYAYSEATGEIIQLTGGAVDFRDPIFLNVSRLSDKMYYFRKKDLVELDLASIFRDSEKGRAIGDRQYERVVGQIPAEFDTPGRFTLDASEKWAYIEISREQDTARVWGIGSIDLQTGEFDKILDIPFRIGHIAANPWVSGEIMYCWETGGDSPQRMWLVNADGSDNHPLYEETPKEWVTHEIWRDRDHVQFNLSGGEAELRKKPTGIVAINVRNDEVSIYTNAEGSGYWHNTGTSDGKWGLADTFTGRLDLINLRTSERTPLTAGHRDDKRIHLHSSVSPDNKKVLFNSSYLGGRTLMVVGLPE